MSARTSEEEGTATATRIGPGTANGPHRWHVEFRSGSHLVAKLEIDAPNGAMAIMYAAVGVAEASGLFGTSQATN